MREGKGRLWTELWKPIFDVLYTVTIFDLLSSPLCSSLIMSWWSESEWDDVLKTVREGADVNTKQRVCLMLCTNQLH